jgi:hypothetical protein
MFHQILPGASLLDSQETAHFSYETAKFLTVMALFFTG